MEPLIRESLLRLLPEVGWPQTGAVGGWWNRQNKPEIDLVGADRSPVAGQVHFVGSVKWYDNKPFTSRDYDKLADDATAVPGASPDTPLVAVSRTGVADGLLSSSPLGPRRPPPRLAVALPPALGEAVRVRFLGMTAERGSGGRYHGPFRMMGLVF